MTKADELNALADRCEREEASRALNEAIERALHKRGPFPMTTPPYTTSLDAAVSLVPEEFKRSWSAGDNSGEAQVFARLGYEHEATGLTPALALCAAALRARAALSQTDGEEGTGSPSASHPSREQGDSAQ